MEGRTQQREFKQFVFMSYKHRCHVIETSGWVHKGQIDPKEIEAEIEHFGQEGYRLVSVIPVSDGSVGTKRIALFFEKQTME